MLVHTPDHRSHASGFRLSAPLHHSAQLFSHVTTNCVWKNTAKFSSYKNILNGVFCLFYSPFLSHQKKTNDPNDKIQTVQKVFKYKQYISGWTGKFLQCMLKKNNRLFETSARAAETWQMTVICVDRWIQTSGLTCSSSSAASSRKHRTDVAKAGRRAGIKFCFYSSLESKFMSKRI